MLLLLRALTMALGFLLLIALCLAGLALAIFALQTDGGTLSYETLADGVDLEMTQDEIAERRADLEAPGDISPLGVLLGAGLAALGLVLALAALAPTRPRRIALSKNPAVSGTRGSVSRAAAILAGGASGVTEAQARIALRRRLKVRATRTRRSTDATAKAAIADNLGPLIQATGLQPSIKVSRGQRGRRVE